MNTQCSSTILWRTSRFFCNVLQRFSEEMQMEMHFFRIQFFPIGKNGIPFKRMELGGQCGVYQLTNHWTSESVSHGAFPDWINSGGPSRKRRFPFQHPKSTPTLSPTEGRKWTKPLYSLCYCSSGLPGRESCWGHFPGHFPVHFREVPVQESSFPNLNRSFHYVNCARERMEKRRERMEIRMEKEWNSIQKGWK